MKLIPEPIIFEWDDGNTDKNLVKHKVTNKEAEEVFENSPKLIIEDKKHSTSEKRYLLLGISNEGRGLAIIFTVRNKLKVRVISARDMNLKERKFYEKRFKTNS